MIHGVQVIPLKQIPDERGKVMHMLRADDPHFRQFGEIYFSCVHPGIIKAWHLHKEMWLNYAVPFGKIKLVLFDPRTDSPTNGEINEIFPGPDNYVLIIVPPGVWNGLKGVGVESAIVANCATIPHRADEIIRMNPFSKTIPYDWEVRHG